MKKPKQKARQRRRKPNASQLKRQRNKVLDLTTQGKNRAVVAATLGVGVNRLREDFALELDAGRMQAKEAGGATKPTLRCRKANTIWSLPKTSTKVLDPHRRHKSVVPALAAMALAIWLTLTLFAPAMGDALTRLGCYKVYSVKAARFAEIVRTKSNLKGETDAEIFQFRLEKWEPEFGGEIATLMEEFVERKLAPLRIAVANLEAKNAILSAEIAAHRSVKHGRPQTRC